MIEEQLEEAIHSDLDGKDRIMNALTGHPDETLDVLIDILNHPKKPLWEIAMQVIRAIGYPKNAKAIPTLIAHVGNKNSLAWQEAVHTLLDMGISVVVPYIIFDLMGQSNHQYWGEDIEGICMMLCTVNREYAVQCGPVITYILSRDESPPEELDKGYLLEVLEWIGTECANYAIPALIALVQNEEKTNVGIQANKLLVSFDQEMLAPYKYMLELIKGVSE